MPDSVQVIRLLAHGRNIPLGEPRAADETGAVGIELSPYAPSFGSLLVGGRKAGDPPWRVGRFLHDQVIASLRAAGIKE